MVPRRSWPIALVGVLGCSESATFLGNACEPSVAVVVAGTTPPAFTWAPDCAVGTLYITTDVGNAMWLISSDPEADLTPTNRIASGVVYGVVPAGAQQFGDLVALEAGQQYRVFLSVTDSHGDRTRVGAGTFGAPSE